MAPACRHEHLRLDVSPHAAQAGFQRPPLAKRKAATTASGRATSSIDDIVKQTELESLFPGPLVLPGDALALEPKDPPQTLRSWAMTKERNPVTRRRQTIYLASVPHISSETGNLFSTIPSKISSSAPPEAEHVRAYLEAFYHPLEIKHFPEQVRFVPWSENKKVQVKQHIGLQIGDGVTRIRTRPCPDGTFPRQLNLSDILDAAIAALPADAYALVLLVDPDLYEDEDDEFCCGRAYGGSRVAVVSSARYHPSLDQKAGIDQVHGAWPLSHCEGYIQRLCREVDSGGTAKRRKTTTSSTADATNTDPEAEMRMKEVIKAYLPSFSSSLSSLILLPEKDGSMGTLWLSRVARTVAHELGHCFCLAHCAYYACVMQGTASVGEDLRQPPYLCPVCLAKLAAAVRGVYPLMEEEDADGKNKVGELFVEARWMVQRYTMLVGVCKLWEGRGKGGAGGGMFAAYRCWLEMRIQMLTGTSLMLE